MLWQNTVVGSASENIPFYSQAYRFSSRFQRSLFLAMITEVISIVLRPTLCLRMIK